MVRAPCCEKMGLKKGPWTREEDEILVSYIKQFGHGNWRALPKEAGLLRCGKSCRLRWTNYLRPDIKRGNFSKEEEDTIIELHQVLGNRWSAIASRLPGRTDNEIKNVWHTHLKKRLKQFQSQHKLVAMKKQTQAVDQQVSKTHRQAEREEPKAPVNSSMQDTLQSPNSPENSASDISSTAAAATTSSDVNGMPMITESFSEVDESFWLDFFSPQNPISSQTSSYIPVVHNNDDPLAMGDACDIYSSVHNDHGIMDFWYNLS